MIDVRQGLGTSISIKIGSRYPSINDWRHYTSWRHGQVIEIREMGYIPLTDKTRYHNLVIDLPNVQYWKMRGDTNWKSTRSGVLHLKKYVSVANEHGSYKWNSGLGKNFKAKGLHNKEKRREWLIDPEWLLQQKYITQGQWESIYDKSRPHDPIVLTNIFNIKDLLKHEDSWTRLSRDKDSSHGSITAGTYQIGTGVGADYATVMLFEADIDTQTDDLLGELQNEETALSDVTFDHDCDGNKFTLTVESGAEHDGSLPVGDGDGAWLNFSGYTEFKVNDLTNWEVSKIAMDISGASNRGLQITGSIVGLVERLLIEGDSDSGYGIFSYSYDDLDLTIKNNIIYGISGTGVSHHGIGIQPKSYGDGGDYYIYNNTCVKNYNNFLQDSTSLGSSILIFKNNLAQDAVNSDYADDGAGWGTHAKNISEDATSPDTSYQSKDLHTNSVFVGYASDNYLIDKDGDSTNLAIIDDGEDLSGVGVTVDIIGRSRSDPYDIGASQRDTASDVIINHTKIGVEITSGTHNTSIDKIINHSKNSVEVTSKSHSVAISQVINHIKSVVEAITKTHDQIIGVVVNHSKSIVEATAGSHNILIDLIVSHNKATVNTTIGSHTPTLGTIISHVKETVEATIKNHSASIDQIIIHVKTNVETLPGNHSVTSGVLFQHTKENVETTARTHLLSIDQIVNHVKGIIGVIPGSHIAVLGVRVPHVKSDIEITPKSHNIITGTIVNHVVSAVEALRKTHSVSITSGNIKVLHTKETVLATSQTHTPIIDQIINHIKQQVELQAGSHFPVIDQIINHSTGQVLATTGVHSIALAVLYNHSVNQVNVLPGSHEALVDVLINHIASQVLATIGSHTIDATAIILTPEGRMFTVWAEDRSWSAYSENRTLQISKSYRETIL